MRLHVHEAGSADGFPIVILHGLFGSGDNWLTFARDLPDDYRVLMPDLPNHGSSPHIDSADYPQMVAAVADVLSQFDRPPVVAGHSMGGKVAMHLALDHPSRVAALICYDMAPRRYDRSHDTIFAAMREIVSPDGLIHVERRSEADELLASGIPERAVRSFLLKNLGAHNGAYRWRINLPVLERDYDRILSWEPGADAVQFTGPALFVGGGLSSYLVPERDTETIRALFPAADIQMIDEAGHWIHADQRDRLIEITSAFLETVPAS